MEFNIINNEHIHRYQITKSIIIGIFVWTRLFFYDYGKNQWYVTNAKIIVDRFDKNGKNWASHKIIGRSLNKHSWNKVAKIRIKFKRIRTKQKIKFEV